MALLKPTANGVLSFLQILQGWRFGSVTIKARISLFHPTFLSAAQSNELLLSQDWLEIIRDMRCLMLRGPGEVPLSKAFTNSLFFKWILGWSVGNPELCYLLAWMSPTQIIGLYHQKVVQLLPDLAFNLGPAVMLRPHNFLPWFYLCCHCGEENVLVPSIFRDIGVCSRPMYRSQYDLWWIQPHKLCNQITGTNKQWASSRRSDLAVIQFYFLIGSILSLLREHAPWIFFSLFFPLSSPSLLGASFSLNPCKVDVIRCLKIKNMSPQESFLTLLSIPHPNCAVLYSSFLSLSLQSGFSSSGLTLSHSTAAPQEKIQSLVEHVATPCLHGDLTLEL